MVLYENTEDLIILDMFGPLAAEQHYDKEEPTAESNQQWYWPLIYSTPNRFDGTLLGSTE